MTKLMKTYASKKSAQAAARKQYGANYAHHADIEQHDEGFWVVVPKVETPETTAEPVIKIFGLD